MYDETYVNKLRTQVRLLEDSNRELMQRLRDERKNAKKRIEDLEEENDMLKYEIEHLEEKLRDEIEDRETNYTLNPDACCEYCESDYL